MKLIASDYDGTFKTDEDQLKRNIEAVHRWRAAGNIFGIITGRSLEMIQAPVDQYGIPVDFLVCNNGASIYDGSGKLLESRQMPSPSVKALVELHEMLKSMHYIFITGTGSFAKCLSPESWIGEKEFTLLPVESYDDLEEQALFQISTCFPRAEEAAACAKKINEQFAGQIFANLNHDCVDITPAGVDKCYGLRRLTELSPWNCDEILVIGDGENDIPMISYFKGATVAQARDVVKESSSHIYQSVEEMIEEKL